ncbi:hypothetical protein [Jiangella sp. DSM 45060]|uniref:hypothetical protein n=1 Tax=Jiangella sp. DSM 45060 TaxID=1798224 RepID=UPI00087B0CB7|nr:hypothetical protein [Jiangella sp. DSM 45060]SDT65401.1 hypothetical protein SAMN04515669_5494 [Jiangella sp. DSM 45060]
MTDDARLTALTQRMAELGAPDPEGWASSEVHEDIAQQARFLVLRSLWPEIIDAWAGDGVLERVPVAARLLTEGASRESLIQALRLAAYEAVFAVLYRIGAESDEDAPDDAPGWSLIELAADGTPTGRDVGGLYEDLLSLDPSGREGADFLS